MSSDRQLPDELRDLLWSIEDGSIAVEGIDRIDELVRENETLLRRYIEYTRMVSDLRFGVTEDRTYDMLGRLFGADEGREDSENGTRGTGCEGRDPEYANPKSQIPNQQISSPQPPASPIILDLSITIRHPLSTLHSPLSTNFVGGPVFSYMVATVIVGMMLLGAWAYKITHYRQIVTKQSPSINRPEMQFVGQVTGMLDCRWSDPQTETYPGASVPLNRRYALASGLMEITYKSGAKVILEGPCTYEVESRAGGYLALGKLTATVVSGQWPVASAKPQAANLQISKSPNLQIPNHSPLSPLPSPLFSVRTPTTIITDLGTEFGVEVGTNGATESHVIQGRVEITILNAAGDAETRASLSAGNAIRIEQAGKKCLVIPYAADRFTRRLATPADVRAEQAYIHTVLADKPLAYWPLNEPSSARRFFDRSGNGFHGVALGKIHPGRSGPLPGQSRAVELTQEGYIDVGRQDRFALTNGFTVEAWVWIDSPTESGGRIISASTCEGYHQLSGWAAGYCGMSDPKTQGEEPYCAFTRYGNPGTVYHRVGTPLRQWLHLAFVFGLDNSLLIYRNGEVWGTYPPGKPANVGPTWVAIGWGGNVGGEHWHGRLAHVAVYPTELSQQQIINHFRSSETPAETSTEK